MTNKLYDAQGCIVDAEHLVNLMEIAADAMVAAKIANLEHGQRADHRPANLPVLPGVETPRTITPVSQPEAAKLLNVGERSVRNARAVIDHGVQELAEKLGEAARLLNEAEREAKEAENA